VERQDFAFGRQCASPCKSASSPPSSQVPQMPVIVVRGQMLWGASVAHPRHNTASPRCSRFVVMSPARLFRESESQTRQAKMCEEQQNRDGNIEDRAPARLPAPRQPRAQRANAKRRCRDAVMRRSAGRQVRCARCMPLAVRRCVGGGESRAGQAGTAPAFARVTAEIPRHARRYVTARLSRPASFPARSKQRNDR